MRLDGRLRACSSWYAAQAFPASIMSRMTVFFPTFIRRVTDRIELP